MKLWIQIAIVTAVAAVALVVLAERRGDFTALWLTPDQRGRLAYENKEFSAAADLFEDPVWNGRAAYAAGRYTEAAAAFARIPSAEGFYNRGNALLTLGRPEEALPWLETAISGSSSTDAASQYVRLLRTSTLLELGRLDEALASAKDNVVVLHTADAHYHLAVTQVLSEQLPRPK